MYESPSIGSVSYPPSFHQKLEKAFNLPFHLPQGEVGILVGLKDHGLTPTEVPEKRTSNHPDLKIYKSSINGGYLACGTFSIDLDGGMAAERNMFTQSELTRILIQDKAIDCVPQLCDMCDIKAKDCSDCKLLNKPSSLRELTENELIKRNLFFDKDNKVVSCKYVPTFSSWSEIFPPHLKNEEQARKVSRGLLKTLNKTSMLQDFQKVFDSFVQDGIFKEIPKSELESWERQGKGVNYINFHHVLKEQTQAEKMKLRIVTNSSAIRKGVVNGKIIDCSLNSCLPQGFVAFNQLEEVALKWMASPVSLLLDVRRAYSNIQSCAGDNQNMHLRRMVWYKDPKPNADVNELEEVIYGISPVHYGDRIASCLLSNTLIKVSDDMEEDGFDEAAAKFKDSNYVDDEIAGCETPVEAFDLYDIFTHYLGNYS